MFPGGILQQQKENQMSGSCQVSLKKARREPLICKLFLAFMSRVLYVPQCTSSVRGQLAGKAALSTVFPGNQTQIIIRLGNKQLYPLSQLASPDLELSGLYTQSFIEDAYVYSSY